MAKSYVDPTFHLKKKNKDIEHEDYLEYRRKWSENPKNFIVGDFPIHLDLEATSNCNLRCFMCFQSFDKPESVTMDLDLFKKNIDEGASKGLCSIKTMYRGEPLLHPDIVEMVRYAKEKGIIEVMFNSNATLLTEDKARALIEAGLDKLICSVDGCTKEVYESVRIGANFETMLNNIKTLQRLKKEMGSKTPIVRVQMVDTPRNHHQIDEYLEFWGKIVDHVAVEDMLDWNAEDEDATPFPDFACAQLWQRLVITADGDVLPCCRALRGGNEKLEVLGNVKESTVEEIWKGDKLNQFRELHKGGNSHAMRLCRLCGLRKSLLNKNN